MSTISSTGSAGATGTLSSAGIGSGLDVQSIVSQLVALERQPEAAIDTQTQQLQAEISAYGALKSALSSFSDAIGNLNDISKYKVYKATPSDTTVLTASASSDAAKGSYNLQVNRIAENHRMASQTAFANTDTAPLGTAGDTMTISVGTTSFTVATGGLTLAGVRDAINNAPDNAGVTASIMHDNSGYRLLLSANDTGSAHAIALSYGGNDPLSMQTLNADRDQSGGFTPADLDASVSFEGQYNITSSSNTLSDTIQGVTLNLVKAGSVTLNVDRDTGAVQASIQNLTATYSSLVSVIDKLASGDLSPERTSLYGLESQLRSIMNTTVNRNSTFSNIFELGVSTTKTGTLSVDTTMLGNALNKDFNAVADMFANGTNGLAVRLKSLADQYLATGGPIDGSTQSINTRIQDLADRRARIEQHALAMQAIYNQQYTALDTLVAQLKTTGNYLTQQITLMGNTTTSSK